MNNPIFLLSPEFSSSMPSRIPPWSYPYLEMSQHLRIQPPHAQQIVFSEDGLTNVFIHPTCSSYKTWLACLPLRSGVSVPSLGVWTRRLPRSVEIGRLRLCDFWDKVIEWIQLLHRLSLPFSLPVPPSPLLSFSLSLSTCLQNPLTIFAGSPGLLKRPRVRVPVHSPTPLRIQRLQAVSVAWCVSGRDDFGTWPSRIPAQDPNVKKQRQCKEQRLGNYWLIGAKFLSGIMKKF